MFGSSNFSVKKLSALGAVLAIILMSCGGSSTSSNAGKSKNRTLDAPCYADQAAKDAAKEAAVEVSPVTTIVTPAKEAYFADDKGNVYTGASTESLGTNDFQDTDGTWIRYNAATEAVTQEVVRGKSLETVKAEIDNALICAPSDANAAGSDSSDPSSSNTYSSTQTPTSKLNISVQQDEAGFAATFNSVSDEEIKVTGCGFDDSKTVVRAPGESTTFYGRLQTADCTVTVTQGTETASSVFHYSSEVVTQGGDENVDDLPDFALGTPVFDGVKNWTVEVMNAPKSGYNFSIMRNNDCLTVRSFIDWVIELEAANDCLAGKTTVSFGAYKSINDPGVVRSTTISLTPTPIPTQCETAPNVVGLVITVSCEEATGLLVKYGTVTKISAKEINIGEPTPDADIWNWCGDIACGPSAHIGPTPTGDLEISCSEPSYEVSNNDASVSISAGTCTGNDAALITQMNVEIIAPCSNSDLYISCFTSGTYTTSLDADIGSPQKFRLASGLSTFTVKYLATENDGSVVYVSDQFQHEIDFQRRCDPVVTADTLEYAKNVVGNVYFQFFTPCKDVIGSRLHVLIRDVNGDWPLTVMWTPLDDGTLISATDMLFRLKEDQAGKILSAYYYWEDSNIFRSFDFTLPINWRKAKAADPLPTFEARSDDAGDVFGKLGELSAACKNYAYNFRIESIDRPDDFRDGPIFDITAESKWASNLPNGNYRVWFYSEESLNDGTPCNAMDQEITVKQAEKPAEPPVIVVVDPIITLPRIDNTNKNDAVIVESQVTTINCALNCYDDLISLTGQTEGELYVQVVGSDGETAWMQVDRTKSVNQIPINGQTQKLNVRVFDKKTNTYSDGSINLNRIQSANTTNVANGDSSSNNSTRNIIIILIVVLICGYLVKTLVLDKRKTV